MHLSSLKAGKIIKKKESKGPNLGTVNKDQIQVHSIRARLRLYIPLK